ncbi:alpha/beta hydrolase [Chryseobacterium shigense]|nr:alpha/beta fold hydrolase [Chryseobacterium shigense]
MNKYFTLLITVSLLLSTTVSSNAQTSKKQTPLVIQEQGSFAVGGTVLKAAGTFDPIKQGAYHPAGVDPAGQTLHGDHAAVYYQIPVKAKKYPIVFWHGHGESSRCWQTTPDGREGFQTIFLRKNYPVYLIDQPRRGNAGRSTQSGTLTASPDEQLWFGIFRIGIYPDYYPNVQFSKDPKALEQFYRQMVPNTGPYDAKLNIEAVDTLFNTLGKGILVTHSQSGGPGWLTAVKNPNIKAVISYEPGGDFVFPDGEAPTSIVLGGRTITPPTIPMEDFMKLTKIPIIIYYGDHIPDQPSTNPGQEQWRAFLEVARKWAETVNKHGGDATVVHLPKVGIKGNTHFPFSDLNNLEIADLTSKWLEEKRLN